MNKASIKKPTRMERARARLDKAVSRLESSLKGGGGPAGGDDGLAGKLKAELAKSAALEEINLNVSERLDDSISRLKAILES